MYADGTCVPKDNKQAMYWYCKAANRDDDNTRASLASLHATGADTPADHELTYFCWILASVKRFPQLVNEERDAIEKTDTPIQRARAQTAARQWTSQ